MEANILLEKRHWIYMVHSGTGNFTPGIKSDLSTSASAHLNAFGCRGLSSAVWDV